MELQESTFGSKRIGHRRHSRSVGSRSVSILHTFQLHQPPVKGLVLRSINQLKVSEPQTSGPTVEVHLATTTRDMAQTIKEKHILHPLSLEHNGRTFTVLALE